MRQFAIRVNGLQIAGETEPRMHLADFLREQHYLTGTHIGCEHGVCGACTVLVNGSPARSCITYAVACEGAEITTIEGLEKDGALHPVQQAFLDAGAFQCAYCTSGMILSSVSLLQANPRPSTEQIVQSLQGNICRCGTHPRIIEAVRRAAETMQGRSK